MAKHVRREPSRRRLSRRRGARGTNEGRGAGGDGEDPPGAAAASAGGHERCDGGAEDGGAASAGGPVPGGGGATGKADAFGTANLHPALNAVGQPPPGGMVAVFDACSETRNPTEQEYLRADLTAHVCSDRGKLCAPYVL